MRNSRLLVLFFCLALLFASLAYVVSSRIVVQGVEDIEILLAVQSMDHMRERVQLAESDFALHVQDLAYSEALYAQLAPEGEQGSDDFFTRQFDQEFLNSTKSIAVSLFGMNGKARSVTYDATSPELEYEADRLLAIEERLVQNLLASKKSMVSGLIALNGEPHCLCAARIEPRSRTKPSVGVLVMLKSFAREFQAGGDTNAFLRVSLLPRESFAAVPADIVFEEKYKVLEVDGAFFLYTLQPGLFEDLGCIEMRGERILTAFGEELSQKNLFFMLGIGLFLLAGAIVLLHKAEQNVMQREIEYRLSHDGTTGLLNKSSIDCCLKGAIEKAERLRQKVGVFFLNLDRFRGINEKYGYEIGDRLLFTAADRLHGMHPNLRLARYDGDKFCMIAWGEHNEDLIALAQAAVDAVSRPIELDAMPFSLTASVGVALYPENGTSAMDLLRRSEIAMYSAQQQGRNCLCCFVESMEDEAKRRVSMQHALQRAIDEGALQVFYQPKVDVRQRRVIGCEALVRWQNDGRWVAPMTFIPLAEEMGLVVPIDMFVLRTACQQSKRWRALGIEGSVAVNMSAKSIVSEHFADRVQQILREERVAPSAIEVEITETSLMTDLSIALNAITKLHDAGVPIALDDFGTGYSSLRYLNTMPISTLKIDKSFIDGLENAIPEKNSTELVLGVLALATGLGKNIVAEGVERRSQMDFMTLNGCSVIQGYLFSKPLPEPEATDYLLHQKDRIAAVCCS